MLTRQLLKCLLSALICAVSFSSYASHLAGGQVSYRYLGDVMAGGQLNHKYEVALVLYIDCQNGQPEAIAQDNPSFISVFDASGNYVVADTNIYYSSSSVVPAIISPCGPLLLPPFCTKKVVFTRTYTLPHSSNGYVVSYQRCCRNAQISNIKDPSNRGATYTCTIPGTINNSSAQFNNDMPQVMCLGRTFIFDHSATDADGDSLSYAFCSALDGAGEADIKPIPKPGPYHNSTYVDGYSPELPMLSDPAIRIDATTGKIYCTATKAGLFQLAVCCNEWRNGTLINTTRREFQVTVSDCAASDPFGTAGYQPNAGGNKAVVVGEQVRFNASGGRTYEWEPATYLSNPHIADPVATFPEEGMYTYVLRAVSDSGCVGSDTLRIKVVAHSEFVVPNAFSPNGDLINDILKPIPVKNATLVRFRVYDRKGVTVYGGGIVAPTGWDGTYQGVPQDIGVYFWQLDYKDNSGVYRVSKGEVTLIR